MLPKGRVQLETGVGFERSTIDGPSITTWMLNNSLIRWGISESAELRMQADYLYRNREGVRTSSFSNVAIGTKVKLFKGWKAVPAISLLGNVLVPGSSISEFLPREWGGQMGFLFHVGAG